MKSCNRCGGKGFVESFILMNGQSVPVTGRCTCDNVEGYEAEMKRRYSNNPETKQEKINRLIGRTNGK